jgi:hypothetical protein
VNSGEASIEPVLRGPRVIWHPEHPIHTVLLHSRDYAASFGSIEGIAHEYAVVAEFNKHKSMTAKFLWDRVLGTRTVSEEHQVQKTVLKWQDCEPPLLNVDGKIGLGTRQRIVKKAKIERTPELEQKYTELGRNYWIATTGQAPPAQFTDEHWRKVNDIFFEFYRMEHWVIWFRIVEALAKGRDELFPRLKSTACWLTLHVFFYGRNDFARNDLDFIVGEFDLGLPIETFREAFKFLVSNKIIIAENYKYVLDESLADIPRQYEQQLTDHFARLKNRCLSLAAA